MNFYEAVLKVTVKVLIGLTSSSVMMEILFGHKSARNLTAETNMSEMECCELMEAKNKKEGDENAIPFWCNVPLKHLVESATALLRFVFFVNLSCSHV